MNIQPDLINTLPKIAKRDPFLEVFLEDQIFPNLKILQDSLNKYGISLVIVKTRDIEKLNEIDLNI